ADQAIDGRNNQFYGYVLTNQIAFSIAKKNSDHALPPKVLESHDNSTDGNDLLGTVLADPNDPGMARELVSVPNANFQAADIQAGDQLLVYQKDDEGLYRAYSEEIASVVDAHTIKLDAPPYDVPDWTRPLKVEVVRYTFYSADDYINRVGLAVAHE